LQVAEYRTVDLLRDRVTGIRHSGRTLSVELEASGVIECRRVVLANGVRDRLPQTPGFDEHYGKTIFTCPSCDGFESRGKRAGVVGRTDAIADFAVSLLDWAKSVVIVTDGPRYEGDESRRHALDRLGIELREIGVAEFLGTGELRGLRLDDDSIVDCDMAFVALGHEPHNELALALGCAISPEGSVLVGEDGQTSVPDVYAAGDLTPGPHLVQIAAAEGAVAGVACAKAFHGERTEPRSPDPAPELGS
jgi:thioredoxin reductase